MNQLHFDVVIFGGGIAGLWSLARLHQAGYRAVLFENDALGGGQSIASQGIIHGGTKYALVGKLTGSAQTIAAMPGIWHDCLHGQGELDLRAAEVVSAHQYLWTSASLASNIAGFFASKVMRSRMQSLARAEFPEPFKQTGFNGDLYRLQEPVLHTAGLIKALAEPLLDHCYQVRQVDFAQHPHHWSIQLPNRQTIQTRHLLLSAGQGNAGLLQQLGQSQPEMQRRPLNMLMLKGDLPPLYAHCLGAGALPRLTITSDCLESETVWYLGGKIAEEGVNRSATEQIQAGKQELADALPWLNLQNTTWASLRIERAEAKIPSGQRPDDTFVQRHNNIITAWPTKLAFAPRLAAQVLQNLPAPDQQYADISIQLPTPPLAQAPWHGDVTWH